jgi:putative oxidoreductase
MWQVAYALGRILVPIFFIVGSITGKFMNMTGYASSAPVVRFLNMTGGQLPPLALGYFIAALELVCGVLIVIGFKARWAALVLFVYTGLIIFFAHNFWDMDGAAYTVNQAHALKNLAIMGGLLMIAAVGSGRYAVDGRRNA